MIRSSVADENSGAEYMINTMAMSRLMNSRLIWSILINLTVSNSCALATFYYSHSNFRFIQESFSFPLVLHVIHIDLSPLILWELKSNAKASEESISGGYHCTCEGTYQPKQICLKTLRSMWLTWQSGCWFSVFRFIDMFLPEVIPE